MSLRKFWARAIYQPTLAYNYLLGRTLKFRRWWDYVEPCLILGAVPLRSDPRRLKDLGVTGVVNMCEEFPGPTEVYQQLEIEQLWLPTTDFHHPAPEQVEQGAAFIEKHRLNDGCVYVHCKAGRARSATIVLWWLVRYRGMTPAAAQAKMLQVRPHVNPRVFERPVIQALHKDWIKRNEPSTSHEEAS